MVLTTSYSPCSNKNGPCTHQISGLICRATNIQLNQSISIYHTFHTPSYFCNQYQYQRKFVKHFIYRPVHTMAVSWPRYTLAPHSSVHRYQPATTATWSCRKRRFRASRSSCSRRYLNRKSRCRMWSATSAETIVIVVQSHTYQDLSPFFPPWHNSCKDSCSCFKVALSSSQNGRCHTTSREWQG